MKYAAGITFYHPVDTYIQNAIELSKSFDYVLIQDNSPNEMLLHGDFDSYPNILYLGSGENLGLPMVFNKFMEMCKELDVDVLATFDQDSVIKPRIINLVKQYMEYAGKEKFAVYAVTPTENRKYSIPDFRDIHIKSVDWVICSGSFLRLNVLQDNNICYDEKYYIDRFDADFSKQIQNSGLKIGSFENLYMYHECGDDGKHNLLRNYYMFRNRRYYNDKYYNRSLSRVRTILQDVRHIYNLLKKQQVPIEQIKIVKKLATKDYKNGIMGQISEKSFKEIELLL